MCRYLFKNLFLILLPAYLEVGFLDHMRILLLVFSGTSMLFSIPAAPFYIPTNSIQGLWFLHILTNMLFSVFLCLTEVHCASKIQLFWIICWLIHICLFPWGQFLEIDLLILFIYFSWLIYLFYLFILVEPCFPVSSNALLVFAGIWVLETKKHQVF